MITDANDLEEGTELRAPVCVVGGGPIGIALALRLAALGVDSLLLESGGIDFDEASQALTAGSSSRYFDLETTRIRQLGGTMNHWGGQSRPLEPIDFETRAWRARIGWPIERSVALAQLDDAARLLGLTEPDWEHGRWFPDEPPPEGADLDEKVFQLRPLQVARVARAELEASDRVTVVLHANVTQIRLRDGAPAVDELEVATLDGTKMRATAEVFVLATGGIETPRLLLASTADAPEGVGNTSGLVGRYFSDHHAVGPLPVVPGPAAVSPTTVEVPPPDDDVAADVPLTVVRALAPAPATQEQLELPGFHAFLLETGVAPDDELFVEGIEKLINLDGSTPGEVRSVIVGFEQVPNRDSRVVLGRERDALGQPVAAVEWVHTAEDEDHMARSIALLARSLARTGVGRLRMRPDAESWNDAVSGQHHHMGTLRMGTDPTDSVVDTDLRFHDVSNLYAAGSAVFPTYGHVNPTLNAVALALRLGEHLAVELQS